MTPKGPGLDSATATHERAKQLTEAKLRALIHAIQSQTFAEL